MAKRPVAMNHLDGMITSLVEVGTRARGDRAVDVDADDAAARADDLRHQRGVVASAGADLEHAVPRPERQLLEHDGHEGRL